MELLLVAIEVATANEAGWQARVLEVAVLELRAGRFSCALNRLIQRAQDNQIFLCAAGQHHGGSEAKRHQRQGCEAQS